MRCETIEIDIDGKKVIINLSDFNSETMVRWDHGVAPPLPVAPAAVRSKKIN